MMLAQPSLPTGQISAEEEKLVNIDHYRSIPLNITPPDATSSILMEWEKYRKLLKNQGGTERVEIDEMALIEIQTPIWTGNYEKFYKGAWRNIKVAVRFRNLIKTNRRKLNNERDCFQLAQSARVLELYATCLDFNRLTGNFITQLFRCNLRSFCEDFVPRSTTARLMIQLTEGLAFVHDQNIVLRDICPENILILNNGNLVISHFAEAVKILNNGIKETTERIGSPEYASLETLQLHRYTNNYKFSRATDVFSLGVILFEMWTSNAYMACPAHLVEVDPFEFYAEVLEKGRPFTRIDPITCQMAYYDLNGIQREKLQDRLTKNLKMSCPDRLEESFVDLFNRILVHSWTTRVSAKNILVSQAFQLLRDLYNTADSEKLEEPEFLLNTENEDVVKYSDVEKTFMKENLIFFYGFSKLFKQPTDCFRTVVSSENQNFDLPTNTTTQTNIACPTKLPIPSVPTVVFGLENNERVSETEDAEILNPKDVMLTENVMNNATPIQDQEMGSYMEDLPLMDDLPDTFNWDTLDTRKYFYESISTDKEEDFDKPLDGKFDSFIG